MQIELINIDKRTSKKVNAFFSLAASETRKNLLFLQNNVDCIVVIGKIVDRENERQRIISEKIDNICDKLALSSSQLKNRTSLTDRLLFSENILSDFLVVALNGSNVFRTKLLNFLGIFLLQSNHIEITREKSLWEKTNLQTSGRADIQIDIYGENKSSILIEHKINHLLSNDQIDKYCIAGKKSNNSYFVLLTSKDKNIDLFDENQDKFSMYFTNSALILTHYDLLQILIETVRQDITFPHKHLIYWLFAIIHYFSTEKIFQTKTTNSPAINPKHNFTLNLLEACYE